MGMKILCLTTNISTVGGIERVMSVLVNELIKWDHIEKIQISSLYEYETRIPSFNIDEKVILRYHDFKVTPPRNIFEKIFQNVKQFRMVKRVLKEEEYDLVITFHPHISVPTIIYKKIYKKKCIVTEHSSYHDCTKIWRVLRKLTYKKADKVIVLTESNEKEYRKFSPENLMVIPNPIPFVSSKTSMLNAKRIIAVGRLSPEKGFDRLIDISEIILKQRPDWNLDIIGDGVQKELINQNIIKKGLGGKINLVSFTKDMINEYLNSSICVIPSYTEAFPMVLLEAMHCGLPVVSFDFLGAREIISQSNFGVLVEQGNLDEFSKRVIELIDDSNYRLKQGALGRKLSEKYTIENTVTKWKSVINELNEYK